MLVRRERVPQHLAHRHAAALVVGGRKGAEPLLPAACGKALHEGLGPARHMREGPSARPGLQGCPQVHGKVRRGERDSLLKLLKELLGLGKDGHDDGCAAPRHLSYGADLPLDVGLVGGREALEKDDRPWRRGLGHGPV